MVSQKVSQETQELAKQLASNSLLTDVLRDMRETTKANWTVGPDISARESAWVFYRAIDAFEGSLQAYLHSIINAEV